MKRFIGFLFLLFLISCSSSKNFTGKPLEPGDPAWMISDTLVKKLQDRLHECGLFKRCRTPENFDSAVGQYNFIINRYAKENKENVSIKEVRYRRADQKTYAKLWGLSPGSKAAKIGGYKTRILYIKDTGVSGYNYQKNSKGGDESNTKYDKVQANTGKGSYYGKICPPPGLCR